MALRMMSDRRSFFGKVFGGVLVALGVKAATRTINWYPERQRFVVTDDITADGGGSGSGLLKKGDIYTISGTYVINPGWESK